MGDLKYYKFSYDKIKHRNSYIFFSENDIIVVDPQMESIPSMINYVYSNKNVSNIYILVSHIHGSHYTGIEELLKSLSIYELNIYVISPFNLKLNIKNYNMVILSSNSKFTIIKETFVASISRIYGHCNKMLQLKIFNNIKKEIWLFLSDNLTTNFVPPITEGGNINAIINCYEKSLKFLKNFNKVCLLPGHGDICHDTTHLDKLIRYFNSLPDCNFSNIDKSLIDETSVRLAEDFHNLNISKI